MASIKIVLILFKTRKLFFLRWSFFMENPVYIQLNVDANEANRLYWNERYFSLEIAIALPKQIEFAEEIEKNIEECILVLKLTPFKNQLRAKLLSSLANIDNTEESNIIGMTITFNIKSSKVLNILDVREITTTLNADGQGNLNTNNITQIKLTEKEVNEFFQAFEKLALGNLRPHLRQPFVSFNHDLAEEKWQEAVTKKQKKSELASYQLLFPFSGSIERFHENTVYALDDLYCLKPNCDCSEVTCVILSIDPNSMKEVTIGGFKYNFEKKSFKNLQNFPKSINAQEWFKQFNKQSPINLSTLFYSRYQFLRNKIN